MKIDFIKDARLSFYQMQEKYNLSIQEVMEQYCSWRASL